MRLLSADRCVTNRAAWARNEGLRFATPFSRRKVRTQRRRRARSASDLDIEFRQPVYVCRGQAIEDKFESNVGCFHRSAFVASKRLPPGALPSLVTSFTLALLSNRVQLYSTPILIPSDCLDAAREESPDVSDSNGSKIASRHLNAAFAPSLF